MSEFRIAAEAKADVEAILNHYLMQAGSPPAIRLLDAWTACLAHLAEHPEAGSPRLARKMTIPTLRVWPVKGFPYIAFYVTRQQGVRVIRVLHTARDIPTSLRD